MSSIKDIPGYAMISGGMDNGKYIDAAGKLYRLANDRLFEVESGDLAAVAVTIEELGTVIGEVHAPSAPHEHEAETRTSPAGIDEVLEASLEELDEEDLVRASELAQSEAVKQSKEVKPKKGAKPVVVKPDVVAGALIDEYSPAEILAMARALAASLDKEGVKHDIEPLEGDDEASVRLNAEAIAK